MSPLRRWLRRGERAMSCAEVGELLQQYLDAELDVDRGNRLAAHLEECRRCGLEATTYTRIKAALAHRAEPLPDEAVARLRRFGAELIGGDGTGDQH